MARLWSRAFLAVAVLVTARADASEPGSFRLRFRPAAAATGYRMTQIDRASDEAAAVPPSWTVNALTWETVQRIVEGGETGLQVAGVVTAASTALTTATPAAGSFSSAIAGDGRCDRPLGPASADATTLLRPVLPERAVAPGHTWSTVESMAPRLDQHVRVEHEFLDVVIVQGMPCAVVVSRAGLREKGDDAVTALVFAGAARTVLSLSTGELVSFEAYAAIALRTIPRTGGPARVMRAECLRSEVRTGPAALTESTAGSDGSGGRTLTDSGSEPHGHVNPDVARIVD